MLNQAFSLSSSWTAFSDECNRLRDIFKALEYPERMIESTVKDFISSKASPNDQGSTNIQDIGEPIVTIRVALPFKDQRSADLTRRQLKSLSNRIGVAVQSVPVPK